MRTFLFLFLAIFLVSCAKNPQEKVAEAIDIALTYLSNEECDKAIKILEASGGDSSNGLFVQVLASAYSCKASFDAINFVATDLPSIDTTSPASIFQSVSIMSSSTETAPDSVGYVGIRTGLELILSSTGGTPGQTARLSKYGSRRASQMGIQALMLSFANLGRFLHYYGDVNASGVKGGGPGTNTCFINYADPRAQVLLGGGAGGACTSFNSGNPNLDKTTAAGKRRLCEGLILVTNILDVLDNIDLSSNTDLAKLMTVSSQVSSFRTAATAAGLGTLINMTSQSTCETHLQTASNLLDMEYLYALLFESGLQ